MKYRPEIDGLRALAVVPVILFHAGIQAFGGGFIGVDIFFVISGYLITSIIVAERQADEFSLARFYERRARRILPALFVVLAVSLPFAWLWLMPSDFKDFCRSLRYTSFFASNLYFYRHSDYFDTAAELKPLLHTWSLGVEEQYYLLFPLLILLTWKAGKTPICAALALLAAASLGYSHWAVQHQPEAAFFLLPSRLWELLLGALAAFYLNGRAQPAQPPAMPVQLAGIAGVALICAPMFLLDRLTPFPGLYALAPTLGAILVILYAQRGTLAGRVLAQPAWVGIGLVSYSAYLWHQPVFAFARHVSPNELSGSTTAGLLALTFAAAYLSWRFVEQPWRNRAFVGSARFVPLAVAGSLLFVLTGFAGNMERIDALRLDPHVLQLLATKPGDNSEQKRCLASRKRFIEPRDACTLGAAEADFSGALLGDSHALSLGDSLSQALKSAGLKFSQMSYSGCAPVLDVYRADDERCSEYNTKVQQEISTRPGLRTVILAARWSYYLDGRNFDNGEGGVEHEKAIRLDVIDDHQPIVSPESLRKMRVMEKYQQTVLRHLHEGRKVILIYPIPEVGWSVPEYAARHLMLEKTPLTSLSTRHAVFKQRNRDTYEALDRIGEHPNLVRIKPESLFCNTFVTDRCAAMADGIFLYYDDDHLSQAGARLVVAEIMKHLDEQPAAQLATSH